MDILWFFLIGIAGGIFAGMGMGGGTLLIPLLTLLMGVSQHLSQSINLIAFLPAAIIAIIIHSKNKLIDYRAVIPIILTGLVFSVLGAIIASNFESEDLKVYFGIFLIVLGVLQLVLILTKYRGEKRS
jgi:uncharacterized membrane protein YfcA